jgi:hypothetical protein
MVIAAGRGFGEKRWGLSPPKEKRRGPKTGRERPPVGRKVAVNLGEISEHLDGWKEMEMARGDILEYLLVLLRGDEGEMNAVRCTR